MRRAVGNCQRVFVESGAGGGDAGRPLSDSSKLHNAFSDQVGIRFNSFVDPIEEFVQPNEMRAFDVPVCLFHLGLEIHSIGEALIHQRNQF